MLQECQKTNTANSKSRRTTVVIEYELIIGEKKMIDRDELRLRQQAIKAGADPETLTKRPLTWDEWETMPDEVQHWHCVGNSTAVDKLHDNREKEIADVRKQTRSQTQKINRFEVDDVPALANKVIEAGGQFSRAYPQFSQSRKDCDAILFYLKENELLPTVEHFAVAFKALAHQGAMTINPSETGLSDITELSGSALQAHPELNRLLQSVTPEIVEQRRIMRMPEKDFKKWEQEQNGPPGVPPMIEARIRQSFVTFASQHPEFIFNDKNKTKLLAYLNDHHTNIDYNTIRLAYEALLAEGVLETNQDVIVKHGTTWVDYSKIRGNEKPVMPVPTPTVQENLRRKIASMSSEAYDNWIQSPANRRAADNLR
jgi:hypothetical protein